MDETPLGKVRLKAEQIENTEDVDITVDHFADDPFAFVDMEDSLGKANHKMLHWLYGRDDVEVRTVNTNGSADLSITIRIE